MDIIEDVRDEPKEWCSNVVLTRKKDGENIKASLDMTAHKENQTYHPHLKRAGDKS